MRSGSKRRCTRVVMWARRSRYLRKVEWLNPDAISDHFPASEVFSPGSSVKGDDDQDRGGDIGERPTNNAQDSTTVTYSTPRPRRSTRSVPGSRPSMTDGVSIVLSTKSLQHSSSTGPPHHPASRLNDIHRTGTPPLEANAL